MKFDPAAQKYTFLTVIAGLVIAMAGLNFFSHSSIFIGDGYIYAQYARNLASGYGWSFNAGETTFATTSPLWTVLLALLYQLDSGIDTYVFLAAAFGLAVFVLAILVFFNLAVKIADNQEIALFITASFALVPFNGLFYAISLMETGLYLLLFFVFVRIFLHSGHTNRRSFKLGLLSGLLFLTHAEGLLALTAYLVVEMLLMRKQFFLFVCRGGVAILAFLAVILPWEWFLFDTTGHWLPTSGNGRLFGYLSSAIPGISVAEYLQLSWLERLQLLPAVFRTQFLNHPVVLVFCIVPFVGILLLGGRGIFKQNTAQPAWPLSLLLVLYAAGNLALYLLVQPLIFQRYLITFYPIALLLLALWIKTNNIHIKPGLWIALALAACTVNLVGTKYYATSAELNAEVVSLFRNFSTLTAGKPCTVAAEPLGFAGYFTHCYIVDLGGLLDPALWEYWKQDQPTLQYALDKNSRYLMLNDPLPVVFSSNFTPLISVENSVRAIYENLAGKQ